MLNIGDRIFVATYGAGIVVDIEKIEHLKKEKEYIKIFLLFDEMNLYILLERMSKYKYRKILDKSMLDKELNLINEDPETVEKSWNKRYRRNKDKLQSKDAKRLIEVLRELYYLKKNDMLPQGEEKILNRVEGIVASEIMLSFNISLEEAYEKIRNISE